MKASVTAIFVAGVFTVAGAVARRVGDRFAPALSLGLAAGATFGILLFASIKWLLAPLPIVLAGLVLVARPTGIGRFQGGVLVTAYTLYVATAFGVTH